MVDQWIAIHGGVILAEDAPQDMAKITRNNNKTTVVAHPIIVEMTSPNNVLDSRPHYDSKKGDGTYNRAESSSLQPSTYT